MPPLDIGTNGIIKQLKNLNQNKATGPDELPARVLKETTEQIAPSSHTSSNSHNITEANSDWLQALVTHPQENPLNQNCYNYRPISLTCILCKVMEHICVSNIWKHVHKHDIFNTDFSQDCLASLN